MIKHGLSGWLPDRCWERASAGSVKGKSWEVDRIVDVVDCACAHDPRATLRDQHGSTEDLQHFDSIKRWACETGDQ